MWSMFPSWSNFSSRASVCGGCSWRPRQQVPCREHAHWRWFSARYPLSPVIRPSQSLEYKELVGRVYLRGQISNILNCLCCFREFSPVLFSTDALVLFVLEAQHHIHFSVPRKLFSITAQVERRVRLLARHAVQVSAAHRRSAHPHHSTLSVSRLRSEAHG